MKFIDYPSQNFYVDATPVEAVCLHGTAGGLAAALATLTNPRRDNPGKAVSSSFVIAENGATYCLVDPRKGRKAWANGVVENPDTSLLWLAQAIKKKINPNLLTWSIEHVASDDDMRWHHSMPDAQFNSSIDLTAFLLRLAGKKATHETVIGHCQISSRQKAYCPGVIFVPAYVEVLIDRNPDLKP